MRKFVAALMGVLCGLCLGQPGARAQVKIHLGYPVQIHTANIMLMLDYAKKAGLDIDARVMRGFSTMQLALTTGKLDVSVLGFVNIGLMEDQGFHNVKFIAGVFSGAQNLTLRAGVAAKTWTDLEGKRIGVAPNSEADLLFRTSAKLGGADLAKIDFVNFGPPGGAPLLAALRSGAIDGFVFWEPNNAEAALAKTGYYSGLDIADNPTKGVSSGFAVRTDFAAKNHETVVALVKALVEATDALNADPKLFAEVAQQGTGTPVEVVKTAIPHGTLDYRLHEKEIKALMQLIHEAGVTKADATPAVDRVLDYSFLTEATGKSPRALGHE